MSKQGESAKNYKIERKWVKEENRVFSEFPGVPRTEVPGEEETWLELIEFCCKDLRWLLSLEHHKFWSHMIYSEKPHQLLISFLKKYPPIFLKNKLLLRESVKNLFNEIERLVLLVFLRLSTEKESENCYIKDFKRIIYDNYLFTAPIMLDICLIYGTSNLDIVKKMINNVIVSAPDFLEDFQEIIPHFLYVLDTVKDKFSQASEPELKAIEVEDLVLYLCDSAATVRIFFEVYPSICQLFSKSDLMNEVIHFYSNIMPKVVAKCEKLLPPNGNFNAIDLIDYVRIDMLKIIKNIFDFIVNEAKEVPGKKKEILDEYLSLMMLLLSEPVFLIDYNLIYSVEFELKYAFKGCRNVDPVKINHILDGVEAAVKESETDAENFTVVETSDSGVKLNSLITQIKDIFPHLEENFIKQYLSYYNNDSEKVIVAVLENIVPPNINQSHQKGTTVDKMVEFKGKHKSKYRNLNEMFNDKEEVSKIKEKYLRLSAVSYEVYDDEYDDTYDDNIDIPVRDEEDTSRRPVVVPRILRQNEESEEVEEEEEEEESVPEENVEKDQFVENPALLRERMEVKRGEQRARNVRGRPRGEGQSNQVLRNREFKEFHKSTFANHNRKRQAARKMNRGMFPN